VLKVTLWGISIYVHWFFYHIHIKMHAVYQIWYADDACASRSITYMVEYLT